MSKECVILECPSLHFRKYALNFGRGIKMLIHYKIDGSFALSIETFY